MNEPGQTFFYSSFRRFLAVVIIYALAVPLAHYLLPIEYIWWIAASFSIIMNVVYPLQAKHDCAFEREEYGMAIFLTFLSIMGAVFYGPLVIMAIAGHGIWDWAKHAGLGVRFIKWYPPACAIYDFGYAGALAWYHFSL